MCENDRVRESTTGLQKFDDASPGGDHQCEEAIVRKLSYVLTRIKYSFISQKRSLKHQHIRLLQNTSLTLRARI